jgi:hypothetical protein
MAFIAVAISAAATIGGALINRRSAQDANAAAKENAAASKEVDYTTLSPAARKTLEGLFGDASNLASQFLTTDFKKLREDTVTDGLKASLTSTLNNDVPLLKNTMNKAGGYNSTSYGLAVTDTIANAQAKAYYASQEVANSRIASEMSLFNPILQLLQVDKGAQKKGIESGGQAPVVQNPTITDAQIGSVVQGVGGIFNLFKGDKTKGPGE